MAPHLLFIGSPLLDVTLECEQQYLERYNLAPEGWIRAKTEHLTLFKELLQNSKSSLSAGGSAQNSARVCKWFLGNAGTVAFAGCVGKDDDFSIQMEKQLRKDKVESLYTTHPTEPTGVCACLTGPNGERSMVANLGAAATYDMVHLDNSAVRRSMDKADVIFIAGYFLAHSMDVVRFVANFCHTENKLFTFSLAAPFICTQYGNLLMECMPFVDIVFGNSTEAKDFVETVAPEIKCENTKEHALVIAQLQKANSSIPRIVVITSGANPIVICETGKDPIEYKVPELRGFVDTVGCGDALAGAFLATYITTKSIEKSVKSGIKAAEKIALTHGCMIPKE